MHRQNVEGSWFDLECAEKFCESKHFDGRNYVSDATGSQWEHESLYRTRTGRWVKNAWSDWQGGYDTWEFVSAAEACSWLAYHDHDAAQRFFPAEFASLEV